jgi:fumarylacetoacetase
MTPSWVKSANTPDCDFRLDYLPCCGFRYGCIGIAIGDLVLDLRAVGLDRADRAGLTQLLSHDAAERPPERALLRRKDVEYQLPFDVGDYTDFYASIDHALNVGKLFRPDNPLPPSYRHLPIAYHGRASSLVVSGTPVRRPCGQLSEGRFGPTTQLDYELELGAFIGEGNPLGEPVPAGAAESRIAGFCIVNDWSARDIQRWEYQPLGPFLGKSFATSVSPWVVGPETLAPYRVEAQDRSESLAYLQPAGSLYDITMEVWVNGELTGRSYARDLYWTFNQMIAHHTSNGCNLRAGDLIASGTISGPKPMAHGSLLETESPFLRDGDEVVMRAYAHRTGLPRIGFGECRAVITAAISAPARRAPPGHRERK